MNESWALIIVAFITTLGTAMLGLATLWWQGRKTQEAQLKTHETINSKMDLLLQTVRDSAFAAGKEQEREKNDKEKQVEAMAKLEVQAEASKTAPKAGDELAKGG